MGKITNKGTHCLKDLLLSKRTNQHASLHQRGYDYLLPRIRTERFRCRFVKDAFSTSFNLMFLKSMF